MVFTRSLMKVMHSAGRAGCSGTAYRPALSRSLPGTARPDAQSFFLTRLWIMFYTRGVIGGACLELSMRCNSGR